MPILGGERLLRRSSERTARALRRRRRRRRLRSHRLRRRGGGRLVGRHRRGRAVRRDLSEPRLHPLKDARPRGRRSAHDLAAIGCPTRRTRTSRPVHRGLSAAVRRGHRDQCRSDPNQGRLCRSRARRRRPAGRAPSRRPPRRDRAGSEHRSAGHRSSRLELDDEGFIQTDEYLRTNVDGVWALGDIVASISSSTAPTSRPPTSRTTC